MTDKKIPSIVYFQTADGEGMVILPLALLAEMQDLKELEDEILAARAIWELARAPHAERFTYPMEVVHRTCEGENAVKVWREYRNLSQAALAEAVGIPLEQLQAIENGQMPDKDTLAALARTLGLPVHILEEDLNPSNGAR